MYHCWIIEQHDGFEWSPVGDEKVVGFLNRKAAKEKKELYKQWHPGSKFRVKKYMREK